MSDLFNTGIRPAVDSWLIARSREQRDYGDYWSASSAGYCMRRVIFERLGVPKVESEQDARKQRVFTSGHLFHEWIQAITKEAGLSIAQELELQDEKLMIRGHIDDLVLVGAPIKITNEVLVNGEISKVKIKEAVETAQPKLILYDYKTQNSRAFSYKRPDMSYYHKMQLGTYMYMLRKSDPTPKWVEEERARGTIVNMPEGWSLIKDLTEARILKISKDDLRMNEEQLTWSPELESEVLEYWNTLNAYWKSKKLPKCTCDAQEGGFMANEKWNGYFYDGEPCSIKWYELKKKEGLLK